MVQRVESEADAFSGFVLRVANFPKHVVNGTKEHENSFSQPDFPAGERHIFPGTIRSTRDPIDSRVL